MKKVISLLLAAVMMVTLVACGGNSTSSQTPDDGQTATTSVAMATGRQGAGILYPFTVAVAEEMKNDGVISEYTLIPSGNVGSPALVSSGECQIGWTSTECAWLARNGQGIYDTVQPNINLMACTYPAGLYVVAFENNNGINSIADLVGKRVNVGAAGQVQNLLSAYLMEAAGYSLDDLSEANTLSLSDAVEEMKNGNLDAIIVYNSMPLSSIMELNTSRQIKLVPIDEGTLANLQKKIPVLVEVNYKAEDTYDGITGDYRTVGVNGCIIVPANLDEDFVYQMTKTYAEHYPEFQGTIAALSDIDVSAICPEVSGLEYHSGALRYYEEQGWR